MSRDKSNILAGSGKGQQQHRRGKESVKLTSFSTRKMLSKNNEEKKANACINRFHLAHMSAPSGNHMLLLVETHSG